MARDGEAVGGGGTVDLKRQTRANKRQRRTEIRMKMLRILEKNGCVFFLSIITLTYLSCQE